MGKPKDITGQRFGKLVAIENTGAKRRSGYIWLCKCDCGNEKDVAISKLVTGRTKSCGCLKDEVDVEYLKKARDIISEESLREGTSLLLLTQKISKSNKTGVKGVFFNEKTGKWLATLTFKGECVLNKTFANKQDAINARKEAEEKYFKPILEKYGKTL